MKARVKATGNIVDATYWNTSANGIKYYDIDNSGYTMTENELDFDFSYTPDYWTRLEYQYAGMAMQGMLANSSIELDYKGDEECIQAVAIVAGNFAHALVEKYKKEETK